MVVTVEEEVVVKWERSKVLGEEGVEQRCSLGEHPESGSIT